MAMKCDLSITPPDIQWMLLATLGPRPAYQVASSEMQQSPRQAGNDPERTVARCAIVVLRLEENGP